MFVLFPGEPPRPGRVPEGHIIEAQSSICGMNENISVRIPAPGGLLSESDVGAHGELSGDRQS